VTYRHGLSAVEICDLEWSQVEFDRTATLHVHRAKNGKPAAHPIRGDELRALRELQRQTGGGYVFETERGTEAPAALGRRGEQHGFSGQTWTECHGTAARTRRYIFPHHGFEHKQNRR
jgi:integrase